MRCQQHQPARVGEVLALVERARGASKTPVSLDIDILGPLNRVERVSEVLEELYAQLPDARPIMHGLSQS
ncbi:hypothetical protein [Nocardioides houyundeii]|uniref:hypothetical protein n=1 Tax=Nocardioides houyundeii TaxID=2045452 RepID=UPI0013B38049|nr:hypothetical protein [Nocardioides houyundeii]